MDSSSSETSSEVENCKSGPQPKKWKINLRKKRRVQGKGYVDARKKKQFLLKNLIVL